MLRMLDIILLSWSCGLGNSESVEVLPGAEKDYRDSYAVLDTVGRCTGQQVGDKMKSARAHGRTISFGPNNANLNALAPGKPVGR
jgi:hypothetical protein